MNIQIDIIKEKIISLMHFLVDGRYDDLISLCNKTRLTSFDLQEVIQDYGGHLVLPPTNAYDTLDAIQVKNARVPTWSVNVPIWTAEEGVSDLVLELTVSLVVDKIEIDLDDLHVL